MDLWEAALGTAELWQKTVWNFHSNVFFISKKLCMWCVEAAEVMEEETRSLWEPVEPSLWFLWVNIWIVIITKSWSIWTTEDNLSVFWPHVVIILTDKPFTSRVLPWTYMEQVHGATQTIRPKKFTRVMVLDLGEYGCLWKTLALWGGWGRRRAKMKIKLEL